MLIVWGKNDLIFPPAGAEPYKRDIKDLEFHLLDTGHFALEDSADEISDLMLKFLDKHAGKQPPGGPAAGRAQRLPPRGRRTLSRRRGALGFPPPVLRGVPGEGSAASVAALIVNIE